MSRPNTVNQLLVRPMSWSSVNPSAAALQANPSLFPSIQIFGYTADGRTIYVRIPRKSTFILKFGQNVDADMVTNITEILNPSSIRSSTMDPKVLIVRAPELSPIELTANPDFEGLATWTEARQDPYGEIEALWEARDLEPYEWLSIERYVPLPGKYTNADLNIRTEEDYISRVSDTIELPYITPRLFFWDIETFSSRIGEFPNSSNPEDYIALISVLTVSEEGTNGYVIIKGNVNPELLTTEQVVVVRATDERDLLNKFFALYNTFQPDRQVYYNGDMFDMPYLLDRLNILNFDIPRISKVSSVTPYVNRRPYPTPFGREFARTLIIPGTETLDLIHYFRRFYPHLKNHRLDTVGKIFLGQGKTGLTIEEMMEALRINDGTGLAKVVDYSFTDSLRMTELWEQGDVQDTVDIICNNLCISSDTLLRAEFSDIIDQAVYNIDPATVLLQGQVGTPDHLKEAVSGIYRNVYVYDYSELYRNLMLISEQPIAAELANRLDGAPPKLIMTAFYSPYVDRTELLPLLSTFLDSILNTNLTIALEPFIIRSIGPLDAEWLREVERCPCYVSVSKASYIILDEAGELEPAGLAKLSRPKFELAADIIKQYLALVYAGSIKQFAVPDLTTLPIEKFVLTEKLGTDTPKTIIRRVTKTPKLRTPTASRSPRNPTRKSTLQPEKPTFEETITQNVGGPLGLIKHALTTQYGAPIITWVSVKYVMTTRGPVLLSQIKPEDTLDYNYYMAELAKYVHDLQALKVYGM